MSLPKSSRQRNRPVGRRARGREDEPPAILLVVEPSSVDAFADDLAVLLADLHTAGLAPGEENDP